MRMPIRCRFALVPLIAAVALAAPAAAHATVTSRTFAAGTVTVEDPSPLSADEVRFTMPDGPGIRAFVDVRGAGESHIALGSLAALGVDHAVYTTESIQGCQVYTGTTFGEADKQPSAAGTLVFDIRKDELAPTIGVALEDSAGGPANCAGFDGSPGRPVTFDPAASVTGLTWSQPADATGLRAIPGPAAITLVWTPPADAVGVRYEVSELRADGTFVPFDQAVGSSFTIDGLTPRVAHTYVVHAFRRWGGDWFSPSATAPVTGAADVVPAPAAAPARSAASGATAGGPTTSTKPAATSRTAAAASAKRPATPRARTAKASG